MFIAYTCFSILNKIRSIEVLYEKAERTFETWPVYITWAVSICSLVLTIFLYIANAKRLRIAYLTIGTFLLICCAIQLPATSSLFRNYTTLDKYYSENC